MQEGNCLICNKHFRYSLSAYKKYCSHSCANKISSLNQHKNKPFGFKKGIHPKTEFKKGFIPWNWKGDKVGYTALHDWVKSRLGRIKECAYCGSEKYIEWANVSHLYKRELNDWMPLCKKCHHKYDNISEKGWLTRRIKYGISGRGMIL